MKKRIIVLGIVLSGFYTATAQVGIGTDLPNASAQLEVVASDKGVLLPNVALTAGDDATTITNGNVVGMIIYNTATVVDADETDTIPGLSPGYYYWDGTIWQRMASGGAGAAEPWFGIDNDSEATSNTEDMYVLASWLGIGTNAGQDPVSQERLFVDGAIRSVNSYYADYVFEKHFTGSSDVKEDYTLLELDEVEDFIKTEHHLPGVTGIKDVIKTKEGKYSFDMTELSVQSLEKIEELFLYVIAQEKRIKQLEENIAVLTKKQ